MSLHSLLFPDMESQASFAFPQPLWEKYRPQRIADFAGLNGKRGQEGRGAKTLLSDFARNPFACGWIFVGPSGTGKTSMALALANEIGAFVHNIPAQKCNLDSIASVSHSCHYYPPPGYKWHLVNVSEADLMSPAAQNCLLSKLDGEDPCPATIWVFTCNSIERFEKRFLSRCEQAWFSSDAMSSDATALMVKVWTAEVPNIEPPMKLLARIVKESNNNVRDALQTLQSEIRLVRSAPCEEHAALALRVA